MTEVDTTPVVDDAPVQSDPNSDSADRRRLLLTGAVAAIVGVILIVIATQILDVTAEIRLVVGFIGLAGVLQSVSRIGRAIRGKGFEADLFLASIWIGFVVFLAIFADLLPLAESQDVSKTLRSPSLLRPDIFSSHPLGSDRQGLDILGGIAYGARVSLVVSIGAVVIGMAVGSTIGMTAAYFRGKLDRFVNIVTDSMLAFPPLILLLGMVAIFSPSVRNVTVALALLGIPTYIRLARANTLLFAQREFVLAARSLGDTNRSIMWRELMPNVALPVLSFGFIMVAVLIVAEASLSFLGLSIQRPTPTWGNMIAAGQSDFDRHPHLVFVPGTVLFLTVYSFNRVGDKARQLWSPQQSKL